MIINTVSLQKYQNLLLFLARKRYSLIISDDVPLGSTSFANKTVKINPSMLKMPQLNERKFIRYCPDSFEEWEEAITRGIIIHEAAHIRLSDLMPQEPTLHYIWNAMEDERIERIMLRLYPEYKTHREILCDAAWLYSEKSSDILAGVLFWRWDHWRPLNQRKFHPINNLEARIWNEEISPLVEKAWIAENSDTVIEIAQEILKKLEQSAGKKLLPPKTIWQEVIITPDNNSNAHPLKKNQSLNSTSNSQTKSSNPRNSKNKSLKNSKRNKSINDRGNKTNNTNIRKNSSRKENYRNSPVPLALAKEVSPHSILTKVKGYARDLSLALKPPSPKRFKRPHSSRGDLNLMRALEENPRPFDLKEPIAISPSIAILVLLDQSGSMRGLPLTESIAATLLLCCAAEIADIPFGVFGFDNKPHIYRPISKGHNEKAQRLIAGISSGGGTLFTPVLKEGIQALAQRHEQYKLLIIFHDGQLNVNDTVSVKSELSNLKHNGIFLQPIYIGKNPKHIKSNKEVFGRILACSDVTQLTPLLLAWLRALVVFCSV